MSNVFKLIVDEIIDFSDCDACSLYTTNLKNHELIFEEPNDEMEEPTHEAPEPPNITLVKI